MDNQKIQINIYDIIKCIKNNWKIILYFTISFMIIGIIIALTTTKEYKAEAKLVPEATSSSLGSTANALSSMVGINMNVGDNKDAISPKLYPQLISTKPFVLKLFKVPVKTLNGKIKTTYADYMLNHQSRFNYGKRETKHIGKNINPFKLTKIQNDLTNTIGNHITCAVDDQTDVITLTVTDTDPLIAAIIADTVMNNLQKFVVEYRTAKARNDLAYAKKIFVESKSKYIKAQELYASYSDANEDVILQSFKAKQDEMENEMQLRYNIYTQAAQQLQLAEAKIQEKTPVYAILQPATVPIRPSGIGRSIIVLGMTLVGVFLGLIWVIFIQNFIKQIKRA